jgi:hypothetical protein
MIQAVENAHGQSFGEPQGFGLGRTRIAPDKIRTLANGGRKTLF